MVGGELSGNGAKLRSMLCFGAREGSPSMLEVQGVLGCSAECLNTGIWKRRAWF